MAVGDAQEALQVLRTLRPALDGEEVDQLDVGPCVRPSLWRWMASVTRRRPVDVAVVADAQQGAAGHVADAGGFDHDGAGLALGEARIPIDHGLRHVAIIVGAPGHHGRHPGARSQLQRARPQRAEQARGGRLFTRRDAPRRGLEGNALRRLPHGSAADESRRSANEDDPLL
jgi:hypothetical protein